MHLEKVVRVLKAFDEQQLNRLEDFLDSPYFKITPGASLLFKRLKPLYPKFQETKMDPKVLGQKDKRLSTSMKQSALGSHLLKAIEQFLAVEQWQKNEDEKTRLTITGWQELELLGEYEKALEKQMARIEGDKEWTTDLFWERYKLTELSKNGFYAKINRGGSLDITPLLDTLDQFHAITKLRYLCEALFRAQQFGTPFPYTQDERKEIIKTLESFTNYSHPYVYVFVNAFRMIEEESFSEGDIYYNALKQFIQRETTVSADIIKVVDYAINHCVQWYSKGYVEAGKEYIWWIDWKARHNLLLQNGMITPITFRNILRIAASTKIDPQWIGNWISKYGSHLPSDHYDTNIAFGRGLHQYRLKNYVEALRYFLLAQVREEVQFNASIRVWEWMCLFEYDKNDINALSDHLSAFEKYILRNKADLKHLGGLYDKFVNNAGRLLKSTHEEAKLQFEELQNEEHFAARPWLLEQLELKTQKPMRKAHG
jgi:hypothetical protein